MTLPIGSFVLFFIIALGGALVCGTMGDRFRLPVPGSVAAGIVWAAIWYWILFTP